MPLALHPGRLSKDHPWLCALVLGVLAATGFQPLGIWPLALLAMAAFAALSANVRDVKQAAWLGWLFGVGHFTFGNNWIATAFTHQAEMPAVLGWAAVPLLSLYLALYPALAAMGARAIAGRGLNWAFAWSFAACWVLSELMRAMVFTGYAWNPFAMVMLGPFRGPGLAAIAPWTGTYALSGFAVFLSAIFAVLWREGNRVAAGLLALLLAVGMYLPGPPERSSSLDFTLVQPDLRQYRISDPSYFEANYQQLAALSVPLRAGETRLVLWPESGLADYLEAGYPERYYVRTTAFGDPELARARIGRLIGPGSALLTGAVELKIEEGRAVGAYNSVSALDSEGRIMGSYDKAHLVPYGEYLPLRQIFEPIGLSRLVPGAIDFLPGPGPRTMNLGAHGRAGVQICYEIVFSGEVVERGNRPDFIFNPSNDGWFGIFGPPQHLAQARLRALEEGLPVLRSTTTGISAVIDAHGIVRHYLPMHEAGRIDGKIPAASEPTLFALLGNRLALVWAMVFLCFGHIALRQRQR